MKNRVVSVLVLVLCIFMLTACTSATSDESTKQVAEPQVPSEFADACPVAMSFVVEENIIGLPEVRCNIRNTTDKDIAALSFYFAPKNVYNEDVSKDIFAQNKLTTDEIIPAQSSVSRSWQLLDQQVKSGTAYVYNVYFADGTQWGNRNATSKEIKEYGLCIEP